MTLSSGQTVTGVRTIAAYLSALSKCKLLGSSALERAQVDQWLEYWQTQLESYINDGPLLKGELRVSQLENIFLVLLSGMQLQPPVSNQPKCQA